MLVHQTIVAKWSDTLPRSAFRIYPPATNCTPRALSQTQTQDTHLCNTSHTLSSRICHIRTYTPLYTVAPRFAIATCGTECRAYRGTKNKRQTGASILISRSTQHQQHKSHSAASNLNTNTRASDPTQNTAKPCKRWSRISSWISRSPHAKEANNKTHRV